MNGQTSDPPVPNQPLKLMFGDLEETEAILRLLSLFLDNDDFREGLLSVWRRHRSLFSRIEELAYATEPSDWVDNPIQKQIDEGADPRPLIQEGFTIAYRMISDAKPQGVLEYNEALLNHRHAWGIVGRDEETEFSWHILVHGKLMQLAGLSLWEVTTNNTFAILTWDHDDSIAITASALDVAQRGGKQVAGGLAPQLTKLFYRPRPRREDSIQWLYQRLALGVLPRDIAETAGESPQAVQRYVSRDARLVGLKLPRGWPRGRSTKGQGGRILQRTN